jgi:drug/metabolite transporter (DMT)-like permease
MLLAGLVCAAAASLIWGAFYLFSKRFRQKVHSGEDIQLPNEPRSYGPWQTIYNFLMSLVIMALVGGFCAFIAYSAFHAGWLREDGRPAAAPQNAAAPAQFDRRWIALPNGTIVSPDVAEKVKARGK